MPDPPELDLPFNCPIALAFGADGTLFVCNGSAEHPPSGWARDPGTGLIPDVEQRVGAGGLAYTKAVYITRLTDVFGKVVKDVLA